MGWLPIEALSGAAVASPGAVAVAAVVLAPSPSAERTRVLEALASCGGNQSRAAMKLGVSRKVLIAHLDAYGVARPRKPARK